MKRKKKKRLVQSDAVKRGRDLREAISICEGLIYEQRSNINEHRYKQMVCELQSDIAKIQERIAAIHERYEAGPAKLNIFEEHLMKLKVELVEHQCRDQIERMRRLQRQLTDQTSVN